MLSNLKKGIFPFIIAFSALSVSASAAFYSVSGLSKLFAGASLEVIIMASSLEIAKLVIASLLYQYWDVINKGLRTYLSIATVILVLITSMGIYGFLSAAYQETANRSGNIDSQVSLVEVKRNNIKEQLATFNSEKESINQSVTSLRAGLSNNVQSYTDKKGNVITSTSSSNRKSLESQLDQAIKRQTDVNARVDELNTKLFEFETQIVEIKTDPKIAGELGPLKFLSNLTGVAMDKIINILLLIIIFVFDPLAISLVIAANFAFEKAYPKKEYKENLYGEKEEIREKSKQALIEMMAKDEESGLYEEDQYELASESPVEFDDDSIEDVLKKKEYEFSQHKNHTSDIPQRQRLEEEIKFLRKLVENGETKLY